MLAASANEELSLRREEFVYTSRPVLGAKKIVALEGVAESNESVVLMFARQTPGVQRHPCSVSNQVMLFISHHGLAMSGRELSLLASLDLAISISRPPLSGLGG